MAPPEAAILTEVFAGPHAVFMFGAVPFGP